jgi:hypothetical protein
MMRVTPVNVDAPRRRQGCDAPQHIVHARAVLFEGPMEYVSPLLSYMKDLKQSSKEMTGDVQNVMSQTCGMAVRW